MRCFTHILKTAVGLPILLGFALVAQGCFDNTAPPSSEPTYAGPEEYANYGYSSDPFIYGVYDPFSFGYWCPLPIYYYWHPGYRHGCDDGSCGPHGGKKPLRPVYPWPLAAPRSLVAQASNPEKSTPATSDSRAPAQPTISLSDSDRSADVYRSQGSMAHGFSSGLGGVGHGSSRR
jgi:hypothetical protein